MSEEVSGTTHTYIVLCLDWNGGNNYRMRRTVYGTPLMDQEPLVRDAWSDETVLAWCLEVPAAPAPAVLVALWWHRDDPQLMNVPFTVAMLNSPFGQMLACHVARVRDVNGSSAQTSTPESNHGK